MAEQKTGAAKHSADYREREKKKAEKLGIEDVTITMPAGIKKALAAELKRHGYKQVQELWQDMALSWIAQDPEERARRLERPDAPAFYISPKLAREFEAASQAEIRRYPGDEIEYPSLSASSP
ncbi:hypothetical protein HP546_20150 [Pseudomonas sp. CM25]|nr:MULTISPECIES: hypothetical protein [unclassified Pseudomonas]EKT4568428.1 hypothetical protein [Pseudomonas putida]NQD57648.1 hypothetical protein [Pseudomonas sp. CM25]PWY47199.1 hypothetical protein DK184_22080 [Pseudomonas sp. RW405]